MYRKILIHCQNQSRLSMSVFIFSTISQILKTKFYVFWTQTCRNWMQKTRHVFLSPKLYPPFQRISLSIPHFISCSGISISSCLQSILNSGDVCIFLSPRLFLHPVIFISFYYIYVYHCKKTDHIVFPFRSSVSNLLIFKPLTYT